MLFVLLTGASGGASNECEGALSRPIPRSFQPEHVMFSLRAQLPLGTRPYRTGWPGCAFGKRAPAHGSHAASGAPVTNGHSSIENTHLICACGVAGLSPLAALDSMPRQEGVGP
jgi:hypothetical protein